MRRSCGNVHPAATSVEEIICIFLKIEFEKDLKTRKKKWGETKKTKKNKQDKRRKKKKRTLLDLP